MKITEKTALAFTSGHKAAAFSAVNLRQWRGLGLHFWKQATQVQKPNRFSGVLEHKSCVCACEDVHKGETSSTVFNWEPWEVPWLCTCSHNHKHGEIRYGYSINMLEGWMASGVVSQLVQVVSSFLHLFKNKKWKQVLVYLSHVSCSHQTSGPDSSHISVTQ